MMLLPSFTPARFASIDAALDRVFCCDALQLLKSLPDASVSLIATDPPYNGVKDDAWDNQWASDDDFIAWIGELCREWRRVLKANGSLYVFASPRMAARVEVEIARWFNVLNHLVWRKEQARHKGADIDMLRGYFPQTERIVFAEQYGADTTADDLAGFTQAETNLKKRLWGDEIARAMDETVTTAKELTGAIGAFKAINHGGAVSNWLLGLNVPTPEQYASMRAYLNSKGGDYLRREYEDLRREYEDLRRPFNASPYAPYTDVWEFATVGAYDGKHPAEKPLKLMEHIVLTSSRPGDVVLDCFAGSGTTLDAARRQGRRFIGCDFTPQWAAYTAKRVTLPYTLPMFAGAFETFVESELDTSPLSEEAEVTR